ncbi:MAG: aldehyde dehydrogenase (NADP(+)), partial [Chloroflexi bacterium]|nr:aldehyde dehydrogenase (NADP(+)) [Chloroflexota bacterium]
AVDPRTRIPHEAVFTNASESEIDRAVTKAASAFDSMRKLTTHQRAELLDQIAAQIEALGDPLIEMADAETGLGVSRLTGERSRTTGQLRKFAELLREGSYVEAIIDTARPDRTPAPRSDIRRMLIPIGPTAVFAASNFPFAFSVAGGDTASALAAGCPIIVKAHPSHPATSELFAHAINRAIEHGQLPPGIFSLVQGDQISVGQMLVRHPGICAAAFTGSLRGGRALYDAAAQRPVPIPVYAEMGSTNPVIILPGALEQRGQQIAQGLVQSVTLGSGQFCTNPGIVFWIDSPHTQIFVETITALMTGITPGVLLNANVERGLVSAVEYSLSQSEVERLTGGSAVKGESYCYANTVLQTSSSAFRSNPALQNEHFGPVTLLVRCESYADLLSTLEVLHGNLTAAVHAIPEDGPLAIAVLELLREKVGRLIWNGFPTGVEVVHAMQHGGPYPATTAPNTTSVGMTAIQRFLRPIAFQDLPDIMLPDALKDANPLGIWRKLDEQFTREPAARR